MRPLDPELLRAVRPARTYVALTVGVGLASAALVVAQALLLAALLAPAVQRTGTAASAVAWGIGGLLAVVGGRCVVAWAQERYALRAAARTIADLRTQVVTATARRGPRGGGPAAPEVATLATRGLDALEPYLVRYVPQLVLTALLTPALVVVVWGLDWVSAVIVLVTLPLVPLFMVLVGRLTAGASERRLATVQRLGAQVLDLVAGLPTLRAFGRALGPAARVRALGDASRRATMGTLRIAFLSSMVLELLTTLSVAIVAVGVGLRLVEGAMPLEPALAVLVLAPEVYLPLRRVGAEFHASVDGVAAASAALTLSGAGAGASAGRPGPGGSAGGLLVPSLDGASLALDGVSVRAGDRAVLAPAALSARIPLGSGQAGAGRVVALRGVSGSGKSTVALLVLGLLRPDSGRVRLDTASGEAVDLLSVDPADWWRRVTWVPQRPSLAPGTLREILGGTGPEVLAAARLTGLDDVVSALPHGWDTVVGLGGAGLSVGQRQRVALTTALLDDAAARPLVVLDEPTAHLDARGEQRVLDTVRAWRDAGRTVLVVAHRASLVALADQVVDVVSAPLPGAADDLNVAEVTS